MSISLCAAAVCLYVLCLCFSSAYNRVCLFHWCLRSVCVCVFLPLHAHRRFPLWPLSPDVIAWEQRQTMVTKSQRAVSLGRGCLKGLGFTHAVISTSLWVGALRVFPHVCWQMRDTEVKKTKKCTGESADGKWELRLERCTSSCFSSAGLRNRAGCSCVICCFDTVSQGRDECILEWR